MSDEELDAILFKTGVEEDDDDEKLSPGKLFSTAIKLAVQESSTSRRASVASSGNKSSSVDAILFDEELDDSPRHLA